jgi:transcriptional regulator with XRE-family HTH domain
LIICSPINHPDTLGEKAGWWDMGLGERIREKREELGLTQLQLAQALGVTPQHISVVEQNKRAPSLDLLAKWAHELGVTTDYLITGKESVVSDFGSVIKADDTLSLDIKRALVTIVEQLHNNK